MRSLWKPFLFAGFTRQPLPNTISWTTLIGHKILTYTGRKLVASRIRKAYIEYPVMSMTRTRPIKRTIRQKFRTIKKKNRPTVKKTRK